MKFCTKCGNQLSDDAKFCTSCGTKCVQFVHPEKSAATVKPDAPLLLKQQAVVQPVPVAVKKEKKKVKKGKVVAIVSAVVLTVGLVIGGAFTLRWHFSAEQQLLRALDSGDFDAALELVEEDASLRIKESFANTLQERIEILKREYREGMVEYSEVVLELDAIEKMQVMTINEDISGARDYTEQLNKSRTCFSTAESFFEAGDYVEAMEMYAQVIEEDSNYEIAKSKHTETVNEYREQVLEEAAKYADKGNYKNAIVLLNTALGNIPNDAEIFEQLSKYEKAYSDNIKSDTLENAAGYAEQGDYSTAMQVLSNYIESYGDDADVNLAYQEYLEEFVDTVLDEADKKASEGDYLGAIYILDTILDDQAGDPEITAVYKNYCNKYVDQVVDRVDDKVGNRDFDGAVAVLNSALKVLPTNEILNAKLTEIHSKEPVSAGDLIPINSKNNWDRSVNDELEDALGFTYYDAVNAFAPWQDGYGEYYIDGKYGTVTGHLTSHLYMGEERECHLLIYADDKLIYTSPTITQKTEAFSFEVHIPAGTKFVKFFNVANGYPYSNILILDLMFWPE